MKIHLHLMGLLHVAVTAAITLLALDVFGRFWGGLVAVLYVAAIPVAYASAVISRRRRQRRDGGNSNT